MPTSTYPQSVVRRCRFLSFKQFGGFRPQPRWSWVWRLASLVSSACCTAILPYNRWLLRGKGVGLRWLLMEGWWRDICNSGKWILWFQHMLQSMRMCLSMYIYTYKNPIHHRYFIKQITFCSWQIVTRVACYRPSCWWSRIATNPMYC